MNYIGNMLSHMKKMAERFTYARERAGMSKAELARALKISKASVTQIEAGITRSLKASTLIDLETVTGISGEWVQSGKGAPRSKAATVPAGGQDHVSKTIEGFLRLPPKHQARIEAEVDFLLSLKNE